MNRGKNTLGFPYPYYPGLQKELAEYLGVEWHDSKILEIVRTRIESAGFPYPESSEEWDRLALAVGVKENGVVMRCYELVWILRHMERWVRLQAAENLSRAASRRIKVAKIPEGDGLKVDLARGVITLDGVEYRAEPHHIAAVQALLDAGGRYVTGPELHLVRGCGGKKWSREFAKLKEAIPPLADRILSDGPKGYRIVNF